MVTLEELYTHSVLFLFIRILPLMQTVSINILYLAPHLLYSMCCDPAFLPWHYLLSWPQRPELRTTLTLKVPAGFICYADWHLKGHFQPSAKCFTYINILTLPNVYLAVIHSHNQRWSDEKLKTKYFLNLCLLGWSQKASVLPAHQLLVAK